MDLTLPSCLWSQSIFPSLPGSRLKFFLSRCKFSTLTTRQPMVEFYLLAFPRFPLRKKEHKSYFGKNRTHDFRTSRCAAYLLDRSGDEQHRGTVTTCSVNMKGYWWIISLTRPTFFSSPSSVFSCPQKSQRWHDPYLFNMPSSRSLMS